MNAKGELTDVVPTKAGEIEVKGPDNPTADVAQQPRRLKLPVYNLKRSGGYEGLAMSKDGCKLYGLLEGPLFVDGAAEKADGQTAASHHRTRCCD